MKYEDLSRKAQNAVEKYRQERVTLMSALCAQHYSFFQECCAAFVFLYQEGLRDKELQDAQRVLVDLNFFDK